MTPTGVVEMGTSPSCLALNAAGTRLYSANETDRVGDDKQGTVSAFAINRADGRLELLNTVRSGGAGPTYVSVHPGGRHLLVANYFGGSVAVLPILADGRLGDALGRQGRCRDDRARAGDPRSARQLRPQRPRSDARPHDPGRSLGALRASRRPGPGQDLRLEVRRRERRADAERSAFGLLTARRRAAAFSLSPQRPMVLFDSGRRLDHRAVRLRLRSGTPDRAADDLHAATRLCRQQFLLRDPGVQPTGGTSTQATGCTTASPSSQSGPRAT